MKNTLTQASTETAGDAGGDPWLLTPGPLSTSLSVKHAMLRDLGSRDREFIAVTHRIRESLLGLVDGYGSHECVPVQGSGTFAVEAMIGTFLPEDGKLLILVNGAYGRRMARHLRTHWDGRNGIRSSRLPKTHRSIDVARPR